MKIKFIIIIMLNCRFAITLCVFSREGYPKDLVSGHGPQFIAREVKNFLQERGIKHTLPAVYRPQAKGQVERFNRVLKEYLQVCLQEQRPLKETTKEYLGVYRFTPHASTGQTPAVQLHGRHLRTRFDMVGDPL